MADSNENILPPAIAESEEDRTPPAMAESEENIVPPAMAESEENSLPPAVAEAAEEKVYGGCEGPDSVYVKLVSSDGHEFIIKREHAYTSGTIKSMLGGPGAYKENEANEVLFREIPSHVLQKVCEYFAYKVRYANSTVEIPNFEIEVEIALEVLMAANFLEC